ncbi:serine O-acetyltransferase [Microbacterium terrisoli]|uniref:serine O-acetyltransferase n=1 Tax=Microbacterium terrisoli TaxID=3242192 RepID=UPI00350E3CA2
MIEGVQVSVRKTRLLEDLRRYVPGARRLSVRIVLSTAFRQPGFLACYLFRVADEAHSRGHGKRGQVAYLVNLAVTGADLLPGCKIGGGLLIRHANGIVIGSGAVIGKNCTILQQVTIGASDASFYGKQAYPLIGNSVTLGTGAKVLGNVSVGDNATIGANAVVTHNVLPHDTVAGVPARSIGRR